MKPAPSSPPCPFCDINPSHVVARHKSVYAIQDTSPVADNHLLIIPLRHCETYFDLTPAERCDAHALIEKLRSEILKADPLVAGFNMGVNCGETAGQTIFHTHIHLIPRKKNDTPRPRGGVRGVIPDKMDY